MDSANPTPEPKEVMDVEEFVEELLAQAPVLLTHQELADYKIRAHTLLAQQNAALLRELLTNIDTCNDCAHDNDQLESVPFIPASILEAKLKSLEKQL